MDKLVGAVVCGVIVVIMYMLVHKVVEASQGAEFAYGYGGIALTAFLAGAAAHFVSSMPEVQGWIQSFD